MKPTVNVRHGRIVLVLNKHIAELDFCAVHVLAREEEFRGVPPLREPVCQDVADLRRKAGL